MQLISNVLEENSETDSECSISHVLDVLEHEHFDEMLNDKRLFQLWQLKGLSIIEEALKKSKRSKEQASLATEKITNLSGF